MNASQRQFRQAFGRRDLRVLATLASGIDRTTLNALAEVALDDLRGAKCASDKAFAGRALILLVDAGAQHPQRARAALTARHGANC